MIFETSVAAAKHAAVRVVAVLFLLSLAVHSAARWGLFPEPAMNGTPSEAIIKAQVEAGSVESSAQVLFVGDSSCLMGTIPKIVEKEIGLVGRNLGAVSYLDIRTFAELANRAIATGDGRVRTVVLLLHLRMLTTQTAEAHYQELFRACLKGEELPPDFFDPGETVRWAVGARSLRSRVLDRIVPGPFQGEFGHAYSFPSGLAEYLRRNDGHAVDPHELDLDMGPVEFSLTRRMEEPAREFGETLAGDVQLFFGVTPIPDIAARTDFLEAREEMLATVGEWIGADVILDELPATMPAPLFASVTHLSERGAIEFSERLAEALRPHLESQP